LAGSGSQASVTPAAHGKSNGHGTPPEPIFQAHGKVLLELTGTGQAWSVTV
jgi:hypothetical protein